MEDRPISETYHSYPEGADLGETLPMWRVQTEGYKDEQGMLIGTVSYDLDGSPDGEFISGGMNGKGPNSMAIGRQGNYFHWGFAASPTYMTDEAKLVLVNAIHYIHKFDGQRAFSRKLAVHTRGSINSFLYQISEKGLAAKQARTAHDLINDQKVKAELQARIAAGEEISKMEKSRLAWEEPSFSPTDALLRQPQALREEFGDDFERYASYYKENLSYLYAEPNKRYAPLVLDLDVKSIGVANNELRLLDRCVELLGDDNQHETAQRVLKRYTTQDFSTAEQWQTWLAEAREFLVFTEQGGFKFVIDENKAIAAGQEKRLLASPAALNLDALAASIDVASPDQDSPVSYQCDLVVRGQPNDSTFQLVVKFKILDGWHLYSQVPKNEPYIATRIELEPGEGFESSEDWETTTPHPSATNPRISIWERECVFAKPLTLTTKGALPDQIALTIKYQICNESMCLPPVSKRIELSFQR
ncbi:MAG: hypothetical protein ACI87E_001986 [Mariniblastus sp.]|jgi:hypothetical protein